MQLNLLVSIFNFISFAWKSFLILCSVSFCLYTLVKIVRNPFAFINVKSVVHRHEPTTFHRFLEHRIKWIKSPCDLRIHKHLNDERKKNIAKCRNDGDKPFFHEEKTKISSSENEIRNFPLQRCWWFHEQTISSFSHSVIFFVAFRCVSVFFFHLHIFASRLNRFPLLLKLNGKPKAITLPFSPASPSSFSIVAAVIIFDSVNTQRFFFFLSSLNTIRKTQSAVSAHGKLLWIWELSTTVINDKLAQSAGRTKKKNEQNKRSTEKMDFGYFSLVFPSLSFVPFDWCNWRRRRHQTIHFTHFIAQTTTSTSMENIDSNSSKKSERKILTQIWRLCESKKKTKCFQFSVLYDRDIAQNKSIAKFFAHKNKNEWKQSEFLHQNCDTLKREMQKQKWIQKHASGSRKRRCGKKRIHRNWTREYSNGMASPTAFSLKNQLFNQIWFFSLGFFVVVLVKDVFSRDFEIDFYSSERRRPQLSIKHCLLQMCSLFRSSFHSIFRFYYCPWHVFTFSASNWKWKRKYCITFTRQIVMRAHNSLFVRAKKKKNLKVITKFDIHKRVSSSVWHKHKHYRLCAVVAMCPLVHNVYNRIRTHKNCFYGRTFLIWTEETI